MSEMGPDLTPANIVANLESVLAERREALKGLEEAQLLAVARLNIENLLIVHNMDDFQARLPDLYTHIPELEGYRPLVETVAKVFLEAHRVVDLQWKEVVGSFEELADETTEALPHLVLADKEASRTLAARVFGRWLPGSLIEARKGNYTITFIVDTETYMALNPKDGHDPATMLMSGFFTDVDGLPVIVIERLPHDESTYNATFAHEREHARNSLFGDAFSRHMDTRIMNELADEPDYMVRWEAVIKSNDGQARMLRSELLSIIHEIQYVDAKLARQDKPMYLRPEAVKDYVLHELTDCLLKPGGDYHQPGYGPFEHSEEVVEAIIRVRDHYRKSIPPELADRMTAALLWLYPLDEWPQVGREIATLDPVHRKYKSPLGSPE